MHENGDVLNYNPEVARSVRFHCFDRSLKKQLGSELWRIACRHDDAANVLRRYPPVDSGLASSILDGFQEHPDQSACLANNRVLAESSVNEGPSNDDFLWKCSTRIIGGAKVSRFWAAYTVIRTAQQLVDLFVFDANDSDHLDALGVLQRHGCASFEGGRWNIDMERAHSLAYKGKG